MRRKKRKVLVAGTFDFLHPGHLNLFAQARRHGDGLVVVVAKDATVEKFKGKRPYFSETERLGLVGSMKSVDRAILGKSGDLYRVVAGERPDVIVLGYDQWPDEKKLRARLDGLGLKKTEIRRASEKNPAKFKSSKIRAHLALE
jgi:FAD synthetase